MARYTVETDRIPEALHDAEGDAMFVAWIRDNYRIRATAISWHFALDDAERVCAALNRDNGA
jgi:predicted 3-demethylubiquinone-9 3-methyltransferase (glyoxalase superfamily)